MVTMMENEFVYSMITLDALTVMPKSVRRVADKRMWPEDKKDQAKIGSNARRVFKPVVDYLHPVLEDALLEPMTKGAPHDHYYSPETKEGSLPELIVRDVSSCKQHLPPMVKHAGANYLPAMRSMGLAAHRLVDLWNPFHLSTQEEVGAIRNRFMDDLSMHILDLPFLLDDKVPEGDLLTKSPYTDVATIHIEATRIRDMYLEPFAKCYLAGNGYPVAKELFNSWYNSVCNVLVRAWIFCMEA